jgi:aerobic-type carbon monoxide dehydrogenase small subunit (CoxS/CutS family)
VKIALDVNGAPREVDASPAARLLDVLREDLRLTGAKEGCGEGECGSCSVLLDGEVVASCLVAIGQCGGRSVVTVEGLARGEALHPVQRALLACGGAQCGICTPGMIMAALALPPHPTLAQVRTGLAGNLCRCTGYEAICRAVRRAAEEQP